MNNKNGEELNSMKITLIFLTIPVVSIVANFEYPRRVKRVVDYAGQATVAKEGDIPYIALIEVRHPHTGRFMPICAGAIISEYDILTSAVCASSCQYTPNCRLYVGRYMIRTGGTQIKINDTVWHPTYIEMDTIRGGYDPTFLESIIDLGIIHTEKISLSETIKIIQMSNRTVKDSEEAMIAGWGLETDPSLFKGDDPKVSTNCIKLQFGCWCRKI